MKKFVTCLGGLLAGILNGMLGAGGGMIIVPILTKLGLEQQNAHATSVCIIMPICIVSAITYLYSGHVSFFDASPYLIWGIVGAILGTWILQKISPKLLRRIFGGLMIWAAIRMVLK